MAKLLDGADLGGQRATNAADPTSPQDLATRAYVLANAGGNTRATATATTVSLATGAADTTTAITLSKGYVLYSIQTSRKARVTLYETAAAMAADATRAVGTDPASSAGVVFDYVTAAAATTYSLSPPPVGVNLESVPSTSISMRVTNADTTGTVVVTLIYVRTE